MKTIYALLVIFRLTSMAFMDKKLSESTKLSLFRKEKVNERHIEDNTILWEERVEGKMECERVLGECERVLGKDDVMCAQEKGFVRNGQVWSGHTIISRQHVMTYHIMSCHIPHLKHRQIHPHTVAFAHAERHK